MEAVMTYAQTFFGWLLQTTLIASVVICLILLIQKMLGGKLGPRWCHALWLVLLIRMILPWAPSSRLSLSNLIPSWDSQVQRQQRLEPVEQKVSPAEQTAGTSEAITSREPEAETAIRTSVAPKPSMIANAEDGFRPRLVSLRQVLLILWLAGAIVIGAYLLMSNFALWRIVKRDSPLVNQSMLELFEECKAQMGVQSLVVVVPSNKVRSPGLFGFIRPRLLLPLEMLETASVEEMRYVFLHELAHLKRHDIYFGWLTSLLQVLHWFNPLIWFAFYRMRADRELACDALVLTRTGQDKSHEYGGAIVELVRRFSRSRPLPAMAGVIESGSQLKRRITMITQFKKNSYQWSPLAVILIIILACVSLPDAKHTKASGISAAKPATVPAVRRILDNSYFAAFGEVSPDGKYISYVDWKTGGDLAVQELATGETRRLTNKGTGSESSGSALYSIFSPDSDRICYTWRNKDGADELRIVGLDGSEPRILAHRTYIQPTDWSPDGEHILGLKGIMMNEIVLVSVADGSVSVVKSLDSGFPWEMQFSPNGRYIAFDLMRSDRKRDIFLLTADGTQETPLVEHPADDRLLGWAPDGNRIVFASDRTERQSIWLIQVDDGKPQGLRQLAGPQMGSFEPLGLTREGSFYFGLTSGGTNIYTAKLDPQTHKLLAPPVMAIRRREGQNVASDWSPDGQYLACLSLNWRGMAAGTEHLLFILSVETNQLQEISTELRGIVSSLRWSPDGRSILCWAPAKPWRWGIQQMDVQTGELTTVTKGGRSGPIWAPDGKAVFYRRNTTRAERGPNRTISIIRREIDTGAEQELYSSLKIANLTVSSDGRHLAFSDTAALKVLSVTGGEPREVAKLEDVSTIAWTRDSRYLLFGKGKFGTELWRIPSEGGEPEKLDLTMHRLKHLRVHPDGQRITFAGQAQPSKNELWVMENFLPEDVGK